MRTQRRNITAVIVLIAVLNLCAACGQAATVPPTGSKTRPLLPGQQLWPTGASSFLYGINQSVDWSANNLENTPAAQDVLKRTGFTLIRTFFTQKDLGWPFHGGDTTDADLELRFRAVENSGAQCLGVLSISAEPQFDSSLQFLDHVLSYAETKKPGAVRCRLWEYGNEYGDMAAYVKRWNHDVAYLRGRHPEARFIGPVLPAPYIDQLQTFLMGVKASGVLPDAISYHDYPCYKNPDYIDTPADAAACDALITPRYGNSIREVQRLIRTTLGKDLPLGITEWNVSPNFVNKVAGRIPLTVSPTYQPHFIKEIYAAMRAANLDFAAQEDAMCGGGEGTAGSLDLIDPNGVGRPWITAFQAEIASARRGFGMD
jgi:hypothetical protein